MLHVERTPCSTWADRLVMLPDRMDTEKIAISVSEKTWAALEVIKLRQDIGEVSALYRAAEKFLLQQFGHDQKESACTR